MDADPFSKEALRLIVKALLDNNILETLFLPSRSTGFLAVKETESLKALQKVINEKRRKQGCYKTLGILF